MSMLLDYEKNILLDVNNDSCMFVCAEGLGLDTIIYYLIKLHNDPHNLVLISNYSLPEAKYITGQLILEREAYSPFIITADVSTKERLEAYRRGGIVFVSSRILVVDLLRGTMPVELVTGVLVLRCHNLHESSQEAFMLKLLREKNPQIFIKTFTDNAVTLMSGYNRVEHLMNQFCVPRLLLWPRFNLDVVNTLTKCPITVEEVQVFLSEKSINCQRCLLEMIKATLRELVDNNPILNNDEFSLESALTNSFTQMTSLYIDPIWHQLTQTSHRLLADVASLRRLIFQLVDQDAVAFLDDLEELRQSELSSLRMSKSMQVSSLQRAGNFANWLLMSQAEQLLMTARSRVYDNYEKRTYSVEMPPKLGALTSVLDEVCGVLTDDDRQQNCPVLVLLRHPRSAQVVSYYLRQGKSKLLDWLVQGRSAYEHPPEPSEVDSPPPKRPPLEPSCGSGFSMHYRRGRSGSRQIIACTGAPCIIEQSSKCIQSEFPSKPKSSMPPENLKAVEEEEEEEEEKKEENLEAPVLDLPAGCSVVNYSIAEGKEIKIILRVPPPGCGEEGAMGLSDTRTLDGPAGRLAAVLTRLRPRSVIFFEPHVAWVREVEVYSAREARRRMSENLAMTPVRVYFMVYKDSVEEQRYLTRLRREKEAFESLISLRGSVVVRKAEPVITSEIHEDSLEPVQTAVVFVDVREFRSELPALLHRKGLRVNPITLAIGDYILAPHICVERKSVSDLIGSLNSGRLFQQCTAMSRHYLNPVLLIEFSMPANGEFAFPSKFIYTGAQLCKCIINRIVTFCDLSGVTYRPPQFRSIASATSVASFALFTGRNAVVSADARTDLDPHHLMPRLVLLLIHFPRLRVLWSVTPYCTAELFAELKTGRAEPTIEQLPHDSDGLGEENADVVQMLLRLPGISWRNYQRIMARVGSIADLVDCSLERLTDILENSEHAQRLYDFLHSEWTPSPEPSIGATSDELGIKVGGKRPRFALATRVKTRARRK